MHNKLLKIGYLTALIMLLAAMPAHALTFGFDYITDGATGEEQFSVDVDDMGDGQVSFTFSNAGDEALHISNVYFDDTDSGLLGKSKLIKSEGVKFKNDKKGELSEGEKYGFDSDYS